LVDDWKNLYERNIDLEILEMAIKEFLKWCYDGYIAFLWPYCKNHVGKNRHFLKKLFMKKILSYHLMELTIY